MDFGYCLDSFYLIQDTAKGTLNVFYNDIKLATKTSNTEKEPAKKKYRCFLHDHYISKACSHVVELNMLMRTRQRVTSRTILAGTTSWSWCSVIYGNFDYEVDDDQFISF